MKIIFVALVTVFVLSGISFAEDVGNKICPVSGEKVGVMGPVEQYEHNGKTYNFCCPGCIPEFKKNPEKYIQNIK